MVAVKKEEAYKMSYPWWSLGLPVLLWQPRSENDNLHVNAMRTANFI
jgi:hypothetical protein